MELFADLFLLIPVAALIWLIVSIILFCKTDKSNSEKRNHFKVHIIISSITIAVWLLAIFGFCAWIAYSLTVYDM